MQVCTSLFRYDPQTVLQEGQYCACAGCTNPVWDEEDGMSLTWYHHERGIYLQFGIVPELCTVTFPSIGGGGYAPVPVKTGPDTDDIRR